MLHYVFDYFFYGHRFTFKGTVHILKKCNKSTHINKTKNVHGLHLAMKSAKLCNQIASKCNTQASTLFTSQPWLCVDVQSYHYGAGGSNHFYKCSDITTPVLCWCDLSPLALVADRTSNLSTHRSW